MVCLGDSIKHLARNFSCSQWHRDDRDNSARSLVMLSLPFLGATILTPLPGYRTRSGKAVAKKKLSRLKSLEMFLFPEMAFQAVWYEECLSISRS
jgi:hypothetical protein